MQGIPPAVVPTIHTETPPYQPPHPLPTAGASCSSNAGEGVSVALREVHALLYEIKRVGSIIYVINRLLVM